MSSGITGSTSFERNSVHSNESSELKLVPHVIKKNRKKCLYKSDVFFFIYKNLPRTLLLITDIFNFEVKLKKSTFLKWGECWEWGIEFVSAFRKGDEWLWFNCFGSRLFANWLLKPGTRFGYGPGFIHARQDRLNKLGI